MQWFADADADADADAVSGAGRALLEFQAGCRSPMAFGIGYTG